MNDTTILILIGFIGSLIVIISPIIKLNTSITTLNITIKNMNDQKKETDKIIREISNKVDNHEIRIDRVEHSK